jgi:hypothetical protein
MTKYRFKMATDNEWMVRAFERATKRERERGEEQEKER